jgi:adenine-specific DNA-methyltransferase
MTAHVSATNGVEMDRLDLRSVSPVEARLKAILALVPEARSEGERIDFARLRSALGDAVDVGRERFGINWPGKSDCFKAIQAPSMGTLRPQATASERWDETQNLVIEGDNLEVLKLLQKSYLGKVKTIYIDPPYNTGRDFIYPDNYAESLHTYLQYTGQVDAQGRKFGTNSEADGRFHSKWLNMIYPRLYLARNLLRDDGAIFISIDETEQPYLRSVCDEIFGPENFVADLVWAAGRKNDSKFISVSHEYIVAYVKSMETLKSQGVLWRQRKEGLADIYATYDKLRKQYGRDNIKVQEGLKEWFAALPDTHPAKAHRHYSCVDDRGIYFPDNISWPGGGGPTYPVLHPKTRKPCAVPSRGWMFSKPERMQDAIRDDRVHFGEDEKSVPCIKSYLKDREEEVPYSVFYQDGRAATKRLRDLLGGDYFENPKDETLIAKILEFAGSKDGLVLDFFAGSGTTAHAVMALNQADGGSRQYILVQLPEPCDTDSLAAKAGFRTIADITRERVRRAGKKIEASAAGLLASGTQDLGFRAFKLDQSNFQSWDGTGPKDGEALETQMFDHVEHVRDGRTEEDLLYEILLKSGFPLTTRIETLTLAGKKVYSVAGGALMLCLERPLTLEVIRAIAEKKPERVVCLDAGFAGNDQLKTNAVQAFKTKGIGSFKTV